MKKQKLVTILILVYQNAHRLYDAIGSIIKQNYFNIELIIADDNSFYFPKDKIEEYIAEDEGKHIKKYKIIHNDKNKGTVLNLKNAISEMHGVYYITMGGDDIFASSNIISEYVRYFEENPEKMWVCAKEIHTSEENGNILEVTPNDYDKKVLMSDDVNENWNIWARRGVLNSAAICYSSMVLKEIDYDSSYKYIEDFPFFCKLLKKGFAPGYLDVPALFHSRGGISDVNLSPEVHNLKEEFIREKHKIFREVVETDFNMFSSDSKKKYKFYCQEFIEKLLFIDYEYPKLSKIRRFFLSPRKMFWILEKQFWGDKKRYDKLVYRLKEILILLPNIIVFILFLMKIIGKNNLMDMAILLTYIFLLILGNLMPKIIERIFNWKSKKRYAVTHE